jgi:pyroglutamyl-peptidase
MPRPSTAQPMVLVSGFGPFEQFAANPSGEVARALARDPPAGMRVLAAVLPVSFQRAPEVWDRFAAEAGEDPALLLGLGVQRGAGFRLERAAGPRLKRVPRADVDRRCGVEFGRDGPRIDCGLELEGVLERLRRRGVVDAWISRRAGGFVCEWIYHHLLVRGRELGAPACFVHVPPARFTAVERQVEVVGWIAEELVQAAVSRPAG